MTSCQLAYVNGTLYQISSLPPSGSYMPTDDNTGLPRGYGALTERKGTIVLDKPGEVLSGVHVTGRVIVRAPDVTILDSIIESPAKVSSSTGVIDALDSRVKNLLIQDTSLSSQVYDPLIDGIIGHDYHALRVRVKNTTDGFGAFNPTNKTANLGVTIEASYADQLNFGPSPEHSDSTHNDGVQIQGSGGVKILGSRLESSVGPLSTGKSPYGSVTTGSGVSITPNVSSITYPVEVALSYIGGGQRGLAAINNGAYVVAPGVLGVHNNRFIHDSHSGNAIVVQPGITFAASGNVWDNTGLPVTIVRGTP